MVRTGVEALCGKLPLDLTEGFDLRVDLGAGQRPTGEKPPDGTVVGSRHPALQTEFGECLGVEFPGDLQVLRQLKPANRRVCHAAGRAVDLAFVKTKGGEFFLHRTDQIIGTQIHHREEQRQPEETTTKPDSHGCDFPCSGIEIKRAVSIRIAKRRRNRYQVRPIFKPMRKKIIAANWKMNMTVAETVSYLESFRTHVESVNGVEIVIAPPFTAIAKLSELLGGSQKISLGAQNMYFEMSGAFTGEISPAMLRELFVRFVILGHSERRQIFGETDALVNKKVHTALACGLKPIVCVGETLEERDAGRETEILTIQLRGSLAGVPAEKLPGVVIAYEPVWAIGTGRNATPEQAQDAHSHVRKVLAEISDAETANKVRIQYGGSVKPANAATLLGQPDIDGALVGGASLEALAFSEIVKAAVTK